MDIVDILFCPKATHDHAAYVASLTNDHHTTFCELYPGHSIIPKLHFMVHMPKLMIRYADMYFDVLLIYMSNPYRYGPLVRHWTMRIEAKHYFKQLARSLGNFINLPYSLASRHQQYQCYLNVDSDNFVDNIQVGPGMLHTV